MPIISKPPMTNGERQRKFQLSHPGYDARRKSRERAMEKRAKAQFAEQWAALTKAAAEAAEAAKAAASAELLALSAPPASAQVLTIPVSTTRLALPAPVELPVLPAFNDIHALLAAPMMTR